MSNILLNQQKIYLEVSINSNLNKLAKEGIYLSQYYRQNFELEYLNEVLINWEKGNEKDNFLNKLETIISNNLNQIEGDVITSLKSREPLISEIFELFKLQLYSSMITLTLSQVDGIMKEITTNNGFYSNQGNPSRPKYLNDNFYVSLFSEYELLNVENRNDYELFEKNISDMTRFNRHAILHGESKSFGHKTNGIKALLLLSFISDLFESNKEEIEKIAVSNPHKKK